VEISCKQKELIKNLKDYFDINIAGSYVLYLKGIVSNFNDIDILVERAVWEKVKIFLKNNGYTYGKDNLRDSYGNLIFINDTLICKKNNLPSFHMLKTDKHIETWNIDEIINSKFKRIINGKPGDDDYKHIEEILEYYRNEKRKNG